MTNKQAFGKNDRPRTKSQHSAISFNRALNETPPCIPSLWTLKRSSIACLRQIHGVRWYDRLRNEELWKSTSQEAIEQQIKRCRWCWLVGHTLRKPPDHVTRRVLRWTPQGKRKRGRLKTTWRRSIEAEVKVADLTWGEIERKAQDRGG